ncbi:hypothetical protein F4X10_06560 [Candidatus Poribacteria bacterium]|nr:hypothetical protein [Candidatus Poribacteria bacterium]
MSSKLERTTFTLTKHQIKWLAEQSDKTGLLKAEIVRRALDEHAEREDAKEERKFFTPEQRKEIKEIARAKGVSELEVVRRAIDRELNRFFRRY